MSANRQKTERKAPKTAFKPGQSGNPNGRPKLKPEEKDALQMIRSLAPDAAARLKMMIDDPATKPEVLLRAIDIVLERTFGKAESKVEIMAVDYQALDEAFEQLQQNLGGGQA